MKIAVLDDYQNAVPNLDCFDLLKPFHTKVFNQTFTEAELIDQLQDFDALVLIRERTQMTETLLANLPKLKVISQTGKVSNHIDVELCQRYGVTVLEGRGSPVAPAELCWALIMNAMRHINSYTEQLLQGNWQQSPLGLGRTLEGKVLGIWGYGKIGQRIAKYGSAFGMQVMVWGSESSRITAVEDGHRAADSRQAFFSEADVITLHLRLNDQTRHLINLNDLLQMKNNALFVNISRAELLEPGALLNALQHRSDLLVALDVFMQEPASPANEPLLKLPNVFATPHLGYVEKDSYELYFRVAFENLVNYHNTQHQKLTV